jgi:hypothetical protein
LVEFEIEMLIESGYYRRCAVTGICIAEHSKARGGCKFAAGGGKVSTEIKAVDPNVISCATGKQDCCFVNVALKAGAESRSKRWSEIANRRRKHVEMATALDEGPCSGIAYMIKTFLSVLYHQAQS